MANQAVLIAVSLFATISKTDAFLNIPFQMLKSILENKNSIALKEEDIFKAAIKWMNVDPERHQFFKEIMGQMSLKDMSSSVSTSILKIVLTINNCF